jgi:major membrane immunogen (membrane-anchored lipoprotein)
MKQTILFICLLTFTSLIFSCSSKSENNQGSNNSNTSYSSSSDDENENNDESSESNDNEEISENSSDCKFEDGTYSATVDYNNPETGYSATYTLDVEVEDCQVVQINFPNDGYLDEDHISYADIDEDGYASVDGEDGKTYEIQIDE